MSDTAFYVLSAISGVTGIAGAIISYFAVSGHYRIRAQAKMDRAMDAQTSLALEDVARQVGA